MRRREGADGEGDGGGVSGEGDGKVGEAGAFRQFAAKIEAAVGADGGAEDAEGDAAEERTASGGGDDGADEAAHGEAADEADRRSAVGGVGELVADVLADGSGGEDADGGGGGRPRPAQVPSTGSLPRRANQATTARGVKDRRPVLMPRKGVVRWAVVAEAVMGSPGAALRACCVFDAEGRWAERRGNRGTGKVRWAPVGVWPRSAACWGERDGGYLGSS